TVTTITQVSPAAPTFGQVVALTATVRPTFGGPEPTGMVNFIDGTTPLGSAPLQDVAGVATAAFFTTPTRLTPGPHTVIAEYVPGNYSTSTTSTFNFSVSPVGTTLSLASTNTHAVFGEPVITATVTPAVAAVAPVSGTVTFAVNNGTSTTNVVSP